MVNLATVCPRKEQNLAQLIVIMMPGAKIAQRGNFFINPKSEL